MLHRVMRWNGTAPFAIHTFNQITSGDMIFPRQAAVAISAGFMPTA